MAKVYIENNISSSLRELLSKKLDVIDINNADVVINGDIAQCNLDKLIICVTDYVDTDNTICVDKNMPDEAIVNAILTIIKTNEITKSNISNTKDLANEEYKNMFSKFHTILNSTPESIVQTDLHGDILFSNSKFLQTYGAEIYEEPTNLLELFDINTSRYIKQKITQLTSGEMFEFNGMLIQASGDVISISGYLTMLKDSTYEFIFQDVTDKVEKIVKMRKIEEQAIIAGFSRHISHNVTNALTAAGGFIRQIKAKTESNMLTQNLWQIIEGKLGLIEEIVAAYNDYTHALTLTTSEPADLLEFYSDLIENIANKDIDRRFSAYLYRFLDSYEMEYDFSEAEPFFININPLFLKLGLCYIIKDNIRYFGVDKPLKYHIKLSSTNSKFCIDIDIRDVHLTEAITATMFKPWDHQMQSQSYDYWGVMIANTIMERHNGKSFIEPYDSGVLIKLVFLT